MATFKGIGPSSGLPYKLEPFSRQGTTTLKFGRFFDALEAGLANHHYVIPLDGGMTYTVTITKQDLGVLEQNPKPLEVWRLDKASGTMKFYQDATKKPCTFKVRRSPTNIQEKFAVQDADKSAEWTIFIVRDRDKVPPSKPVVQAEHLTASGGWEAGQSGKQVCAFEIPASNVEKFTIEAQVLKNPGKNLRMELIAAQGAATKYRARLRRTDPANPTLLEVKKAGARNKGVSRGGSEIGEEHSWYRIPRPDDWKKGMVYRVRAVSQSVDKSTGFFVDLHLRYAVAPAKPNQTKEKYRGIRKANLENQQYVTTQEFQFSPSKRRPYVLVNVDGITAPYTIYAERV